MTVYIESPKESTKKLLLKLVNEISNVIGYKVNIKKSLISVNTCDEQKVETFKNLSNPNKICVKFYILKITKH